MKPKQCSARRVSLNVLFPTVLWRSADCKPAVCLVSLLKKDFTHTLHATRSTRQPEPLSSHNDRQIYIWLNAARHVSTEIAASPPCAALPAANTASNVPSSTYNHTESVKTRTINHGRRERLLAKLPPGMCTKIIHTYIKLLIDASGC